MCVPDSDQNDSCLYLIVTKTILVSVCPALSYSTSVRSAILIRSTIKYDRGRAYATIVITTAISHTCRRYTSMVHAVSSLQSPGAQGMSLLETSSMSSLCCLSNSKNPLIYLRDSSMRVWATERKCLYVSPFI